MTRCKACNSRLTYYEFYSYKSDTLPELEDLCSACRSVSYDESTIFDIHEFQHEHITENWVNYTVYNEKA